MFLIDDIISGIFGLGATHMNNEANIAAVRETNEAQKKLAEYAFDKNVEMWKLQNAYNTPAEQMKRYSDAGLNPNLVATSGTSGNASSPPSYEAPHLNWYQRKALDLDFVAKSLALQKERAQIRNIDADTELKAEQAPTNASQRSVYLNTAEKIALDNKWRKLVFDGDLSRYNVQARKERYEEMLRDIAVKPSGYNEEFGVSWNYNDPVNSGDGLKVRQGKLDIQEVMQRLALMHSSELKNLASLGVMSAQVEELMSKTELNYTQAANIVDQFDLSLLNFDLNTLKALNSEWGTSTLGLVAKSFSNVLRGVTSSVNETLGNYRIPRTTEEYLERVAKGSMDMHKKRSARFLNKRKK